MSVQNQRQIERVNFHTKLLKEDQELIKRLALKYGSIQKVMEQAIQLLRLHHASERGDGVQPEIKPELPKPMLANFMLNDFRMLAVGRQTFLSYITPEQNNSKESKKNKSDQDFDCEDHIPRTPIKKNNALELIEWYYGDKHKVENLTLKQILEAIKALWMAGNYFTKVEIKDLSLPDKKTKQYKMIFYHDFSVDNYGMFWLEYFRYTLTCSKINATITEDNIRPQSFYFEIEK